jgi:hypothetical protein
VVAALLEGDSRAGDEVLDRSRHEHFAGRGERRSQSCGEKTSVRSPSPTTWYAIATPPARA